MNDLLIKRQGIKAIAWIACLSMLCLFSCGDLDSGISTEMPPKYFQEPVSVALNLDTGYTIDVLTGDSILSVVNSFGDKIISGKPVSFKPASVQEIDFNLINRRNLKAPLVLPSNANVHKINAPLIEVDIDEETLTKFSIGSDTSSFVMTNSKGEIITTGKAIPVQGKLMEVKQPRPTKALSPSVKDNSIGDIQFLDFDQGMNSSYIYCLLEDRRKNLWFGTNAGGVSMYDGQSFFHFTKKEGFANSVKCIYEDSKGNIWFGTYGEGVIKYDGELFTRYNEQEGMPYNTLYSLFEDKDGNMWFGWKGGGVSKFDGEYVTHYSQKEGLSSNSISAILQDGQGEMWFATIGGGVNKFNGQSFLHYTAKDGLCHNNILSMFIDSKGRIWMGSNGAGVSIFDGEKFTQLTEKDGLSFNSVNCIMEDHEGNFWLGTYGRGLNKFDGKQIIQYSTKEGLSNDVVWSIIEDETGNIWVGTYGGGVCRFDPESFSIFNNQDGKGYNRTYCITEDRKGNLWFGNYGKSLMKYNEKDFSMYEEKSGLSNSYFSSVLIDSKDRLWLGYVDGGLDIIEGDVVSHYSDTSGLCNNKVTFLLEDRKGIVWIATRNGLSQYDGKTFTNYTEKDGLSNNSIKCLLEDKEGNIWMATRGGGVSVFNGRTITHYTMRNGLCHNSTTCVMQDRNGQIWIGTYGGGISIFDGKSFTQYTDREGLSDNFIWSLKEDVKGNIWCTTNKGLNVFSINDTSFSGLGVRDSSGKPMYRITNLDKSDGLRDQSFSPSQDALFIDSKNTAWFGTGSALTSLDMNTFELPSNKPVVRLTSIEIEEKLLDLRNSGNSGMEGMKFDGLMPFYGYPLSLKLRHDLDHLTFHFSAIDWSNPQHILYSYKIDELGENWSEPSSEPLADYRNIPYGSYTLKVMAMGSSQEWSDVFEYKFLLLAPWWHTWWARVLYVFIALFTLLGYGKWRTAEFKQRQEELEIEVAKATKEITAQKERAERSEAFKQQFLANMSHEIRTPMNAVLGMTSLTLDTELNEKQRKYLSAVKKSSENLLVIINDILDLSKLEAGKMELEKIPFNLKEQIQQVYDTLKFKAEEKGLLFKTEIDDNVPQNLVGDPSRLNQILINLCGNSIKFTDKGNVSIKVELVDGSDATLRFKVRDTGIGIPPEGLKKLFSAFQQVDASTSRKYGGTGLGLSISKTLVEKQQGEMHVSSEAGLGSDFTFTIPYTLASKKEIGSLHQEEAFDVSSIEGIRLLIAEDNEFNQIVVEDTLRQLITNVTVHIAENGKVAIDKLKENEYDVILMDVNMPEMNGHEATRAIRNMAGPIKKIPILALTASVLAEDIKQCLEAGMNDYIPKPFKREELLSTLSKYYSRKKV